MWKEKLGTILWGIGVMAVSTVVGAAIFAGLFVFGVLPVGAIGPVVWGITGVSGFLGGYVVSRKASSMVLPMTVGTVFSYFLLIFSLNGLIFKKVGDGSLILFLIGLFGSVFGAMVTVWTNFGRKNRKFGRKK